MSVRSLILLSLLPISVFAQKIRTKESSPIQPVDARICKAHFNTIYLGTSKPEEVANYLLHHTTNLKYNTASLKLLNNITSLTGIHLLFQQEVNGVLVYRGQIKVNMDKSGNIKSLFDNTYPVKEPVSSEFPIAGIKDTYIKKLPADATVKTEKNYFDVDNTLVPALYVNVSIPGGTNYEVILNNSGTILYQKDLNDYFMAPDTTNTSIDTTVTASVFLPDPLTRANVTYGGVYVDNNDSASLALDTEMVNEKIHITYSNDSFLLSGPYVTVKEFSAPVTTHAASTDSGAFHYTRNQKQFEEVNAYYHISTEQKHLQALGFTNLANYPIWIDAHALGGQDNSMFSPNESPKRIYYGDGGVDDAEDADVIIHEYGHAISFSAAPNTNNGFERQTLDEANSDYHAASYSRYLNTYHWDYVFNWDGHNEFWPGRMATSTKHYPQDLSTGSIYDNTDIWVGTLMQIWGDIGRDQTDKILLESEYSYASNITMVDAAKLYEQADSGLYNGLYQPQICDRFSARGILPNCNAGVNEVSQTPAVQLLNTANFNDFSNVSIQFNSTVNATIKLYTVEGQLLRSDYVSHQKTYGLSGTGLSPGLYILSVETPSRTYNFKLVKL